MPKKPSIAQLYTIHIRYIDTVCNAYLFVTKELFCLYKVADIYAKYTGCQNKYVIYIILEK